MFPRDHSEEKNVQACVCVCVCVCVGVCVGGGGGGASHSTRMCEHVCVCVGGELAIAISIPTIIATERQGLLTFTFLSCYHI